MNDPGYGTIPTTHSAAVVIIGGGPAGVCAAVAAAEQGADTLLVERYGFLGGMATAGLVNPFMPYETGGERINAGAFSRMIDYFEAEGGWSHRPEAPSAFDPELAKLALDRMVAEAGVRRLLHTQLVAAEVADGSVRRAIAADKSGLCALAAEVFVDASGDADLAARAGAQIEIGRPEDGFCQPMTTNFRVANVDEARMPDRAAINALYDAAKARGDIDNPRENCLWFHTTRRGEIHFNTTRVVKLDATRSDDLTLAEETGRRQVREMLAFLRRDVPGFAEAHLSALPTQIGIRESRRVLGDYVLTVEDVLAARKFEDGIARGCYPRGHPQPRGDRHGDPAPPAGRSLRHSLSLSLPAGLRQPADRGTADQLRPCGALFTPGDADRGLQRRGCRCRGGDVRRGARRYPRRGHHRPARPPQGARRESVRGVRQGNGGSTPAVGVASAGSGQARRAPKTIAPRPLATRSR